MEDEKRKLFECYLCKVYAKCNYYGKKPSERNDINNSSSKATTSSSRRLNNELTLKEDSYCCDNPFVERRDANFLVLGSDCFACKQMVCISIECSLFYYDKRFCLKCAEKCLLEDNDVAQELKNDIRKVLNISK